MLRKTRPIRIAALVGFVAALGCNALLGIEEGAPRETDAGTCVLNSDCPDPAQVCLFQVCSPPCAADKDCPDGSRCLASANGMACVVSGAATCATTDACPAGTTCAGGECRNPCAAGGKSCLPDQTCTAGACVGNDHGHDPVRDGGTDARSDAKPADAAPDHVSPPDAGVCTPNAKPTKCGAKETPQFCNSGGEWENVAAGACSAGTPVCLDGACVACAPNTAPTNCGANNTPQFCNASGAWEDVPTGACSGTTPACMSGVCGTCTPSATPTTCSNNTPQFCSPDGKWQGVATGACSGANGTCLNGGCVACAPNPNATQCVNNTPQYCNASGSWQNAASGACAGNTSVCLGGSCVACTPDPTPTQCANNAPQFCNGNGSWQSNAACGAGLTCKSGQCGCTAGTTSCSGSTLLTCSNDGTSVTPTSCATACVLGPARCQKVVPSNGLGVDYYQAALDWTATVGTTINTGSGATPPSISPAVAALITVVTQSGNPDIAVFKFHSIVIPAGVTVRVTGGRALALLSATDVSIKGTLDASSNYDYDCGPASSTGCAPGKGPSTVGTNPTNQWGCAGSGGGFSTPGGAGGWFYSNSCTGALADANAVCNNPTLVPLYGGSAGGSSFRPPEGITLVSGCGGGATQVVAAHSLTVSGAITASGGGGGYEGRYVGGQTSRSSDNVGGAGGGSGGAILLESPTVSLSGKLFVNGGGGSPGSVSQTGVLFTPGPNGGQLTTAESTTPGSTGVGPGGRGASGSSVASEGTGENSAPGGGGGGGAGRIRVNDTTGLVCQITGPFYPNIVGVTSCGTIAVQ